MSSPKIDPYLTEPDLVVLRNLFEDAQRKLDARDPGQMSDSAELKNNQNDQDKAAIETLKAHNDSNSPDFQSTVFVTWDDKDIHPLINTYIVRPYARWASKIVRHPTDVVFLTHIILYFTINVPSAIWLFYNFSFFHGIAHVAFTFWCVGSFTLMMHNHIHNNGVLARPYWVFDLAFPYILEPLMGHTWDSYYYHHVKHHHVEGNGPDDLSSTIRYQRDDIWHFLHYVGRFIFFIWLELPLYFIRKGKTNLALRAFVSEAASMALLYYMTFHVHKRAAIFVFDIPFFLLRLGLMIGNFGQHALVDEIEPDSDFRSSITLIDVPSNRFCFNDGYHTAHHLNPRRHWRDQPLHFLQSKEAYASGRALVFHNIDYLMMTYRLVTKNYLALASCLVPIGDQIGMTQQEIADMLRTKTRAFSEEEIQAKFKMGPTRKKGNWESVLGRAAGLVPWALGMNMLTTVGPQKVEAEASPAQMQ